MEKYNKIYRIISILNFVLHSLAFVFVVIAGFLPFNEGRNFYESFGTAEGCLILSLMFVSCVCAFFTIKLPILSVPTIIFSGAYLWLLIQPFLAEVLTVGFAGSWIDVEMSTYETGFYLMNNVVGYLEYFQLAIVIYSIVTMIIRLVAKRKKKKAQETPVVSQ